MESTFYDSKNQDDKITSGVNSVLSLITGYFRNSIDEFKRGGSGIDQRIDRYFAAIQGRFSQIIANAVDRKEIAANANPKDKAALLVSLLLGISIAVRARTHDDAVLPYTSAAATMIRSWRV